MSTSLEHDYIGLSSQVSSMDTKNCDHDDKNLSTNGLNLKATELRLGLPGSESPDRDNNGCLKNNIVDNISSNFVTSGAKRGFSIAIHGGSAANWVFSSANIGSEPSAALVKDGLPQSPKPVLQDKNQVAGVEALSASKAQVVGWPPIRSFRKNTMASQPQKNDDNGNREVKLGSGCLYIKVSMDGAPYLRKIDLKTYSSYMELSSGLETMFGCFTIGQCNSRGFGSRDGLSESRLMDLVHGSEYVLTYEDKDGDWMLVGDVPWKMFMETCRRLRIMKSSEAIGLAPRATDKCKKC